MIKIDEAARPATADDLPVIDELATAAVTEMIPLRGGDVWSQNEGPELPVADEFAAALGDARQQLLVGTIDDVVVGYGRLRIEELRTGNLLAVVDHVYVHPEGRGVGVGEALMDALVAFAVSNGCIGIDSIALPGDRQTKNFFETFGLKARALTVHRSLIDER